MPGFSSGPGENYTGGPQGVSGTSGAAGASGASGVAGGISNSAGADVVTKSDGTNLVASRISDDGTTITANSDAGVFFAGDTSAGANGSYLKIDDSNKLIALSADDATTGVALYLDGGLVRAQLFNGSAALLELADNFQIFGTSAVAVVNNIGTSSVQIRGGTLGPITNAVTNIGSTSLSFKQLFLDSTITAGATTGAQTINKSAGSVNFAALATSLVVTSDKVTADSIVLATVATNDSTLKSVQCVPTAGSFTMFANAAATAETRVNFWILNQ